MKRVSLGRFVVMMGLVVLLVSCSSYKQSPYMTTSSKGTLRLAHRAQILDQFATLGTINVKKFIDYRPMSEQMEGADSSADGKAYVLTTSTTPEVDTFVQKVIDTEAKKTKIFLTATGKPQYEMTGIIYNASVGAAEEARENPMFDAHDKVAANNVTKEKYYFSHVRFLVVLRQHDKIVYRKTIEVNDTQPATASVSPDDVARMLDRAVTKGVVDLFSQLEDRAKHKKS